MIFYKVGYNGPEPEVFIKKRIIVIEEGDRYYVTLYEMNKGKRETKSFEVKEKEVEEIKNLEGKVAVLYEGLEPVGVRPLKKLPQKDPRPSPYTIDINYKGTPVVITEGFLREYQKINKNMKRNEIRKKVVVALKQPDIPHRLGTAKSIPGYLLIFQSNMLTHILKEGKNPLMDNPKRHSKSSAFLVKYL